MTVSVFPVTIYNFTIVLKLFMYSLEVTFTLHFPPHSISLNREKQWKERVQFRVHRDHKVSVNVKQGLYVCD